MAANHSQEIEKSENMTAPAGAGPVGSGYVTTEPGAASSNVAA